METSQRTYRKRQRAETEAETRRRITEATMELHGTIGPANTTVSEIARKAGVQRLTVYNHFPDQRSLFEACTTHWFGLHPPPDAQVWQELASLSEKLDIAIGSIYGYYESNEPMIANWLRDAQLIPVLNEFAEAGYYGYLSHVVTTTLPDEAEAMCAAMHVALHFETWRTLCRRQGHARDAAVQIMRNAVMAAAGQA